MIEVIFLLSCTLLVYIYFGYPALLYLGAFFIDKKPQKQKYSANVTVLISAYNEEQHIEATVRNKLEQQLAGGELEVIVVSDESTDKTDSIVQSIEDERLGFIRQCPRQGKTSALNLAIKQARGEIIVFSDANSIYAENAIAELVNNFADSETGYVTGKMIYSNQDGTVIGDGCDTYMRYENFIRSQETKIGSIVGVDGGIDAIRKTLYSELKPEQLPDFVQPLKVIEQGYRVIYEPQAILKEEALSEQQSEYKMRVRVSLRALWALYDMRSLLNPLKYPLFSAQLFSHKVARYCAWMPILAALLLNPLLLKAGFFYQLAFLFQCLFYFGALCGWRGRARSNQSFLCSVPYYFLLTNIAAAQAFIRFLKREKTIIWNPRTG